MHGRKRVKDFLVSGTVQCDRVKNHRGAMATVLAETNSGPFFTDLLKPMRYTLQGGGVRH